MTINQKMQINPSDDLNEIFFKCVSISENNIDRSLCEGSLLGLITEQLDQSDVDKVVDAISEAEKDLADVFKYFDSLENFDKSKIPTLETYLNSMKDALQKARGDLAVANFETGSVSSFFGEKLTLPQITQAAITIQTKANDFTMGFSDAVDNIVDRLGSLAKTDEERASALRDLAGQGGFPEVERLQKGITKAMKDALGGGWFKKVVSFFKSGPTIGAEKKILDTIPKLNIDVVATEVADALLDSSISSLEAKPPPLPEKPETLEPVAQESQEAEEKEQEQSKGEESSSETADIPPPPPAEDAKKEQEASLEQLRNSIQQQFSEPEAQAPGAAVMDALEGWYDGLSKSSKQTISAAGRYDDLKNVVKTSMDNLADTVAAEIRSSMSDWRAKHEETLIKSKRFAKKNFDSLEKMIPDLAAFMIKKVDESPSRLTKQSIRKYTFNFLNRRFTPKKTNLLSEKYDMEDMIAYRMNRMAGLDV